MRPLAVLLVLLAAARAEGEATDSSLASEVDSYLHERAPRPAAVPLSGRWTLGPVFRSADETFQLRIRGRVLFDTFWAGSDSYEPPVTNDGIYLRQVRLGVVGHIHQHVIYMLEVDFARGNVRLFDTFIGLRDLPVLGRFKAGHMREPFSLDGVTPIPFHALMERASSSRAFQLGRNTGLRFHDVVLDGRMSWWAGVFRDSDSSGSATGDGGYALTVRLTGLPLQDTVEGRLLHVGASISYRGPPDRTSRFRARAGPAGGPRLVNTGPIPADRELRASAATLLGLGPFGLQAEGYLAHVSGAGVDATFYGAYVMACYWLTGERIAYDLWNATWARGRPRKNLLDGGDGLGAWMLALRFDWVDLTDGGVDGGEMTSATFGVTWMWTPNSRFKLNFVYADVTGGPEGTGTVFYVMTRFQFDF